MINKERGMIMGDNKEESIVVNLCILTNIFFVGNYLKNIF